jgi:hypothetical protein
MLAGNKKERLKGRRGDRKAIVNEGPFALWLVFLLRVALICVHVT